MSFLPTGKIGKLSGDSRFRALAVFLVPLFFSLTIIPFFRVLATDAAGNSLAATRAILAGEWIASASPRYPMLLPWTAAALAKVSGIPALYAVTAASALYFSLGCLALYFLLRRVFNERIGFYGALGYALLSRTIKIVTEGYREPVKALGYIMAVHGLVRVIDDPRDWRGYLYAGLGWGVMMQSRSDSVLLALIFALIFTVWEIMKTRNIWRTAAACAVALVVMAPYLYYNYRVIGYPVPDQRFAFMVRSLEDKLGFAVLPHNPAPAAELPYEAVPDGDGGGMALPEEPDPEKEGFGVLLYSISKGMQPYILIPALLAALIRMRRREFTRSEAVLLAAYLLHGLLIIAQVALYDRRVFVNARYLSVAAGLGYGWVVIFCDGVWAELKSRSPHFFTPRLGWTLLSLTVLIFIYDGVNRRLTCFMVPARAAELRAAQRSADLIREDYRSDPAAPLYRIEGIAYCALPVVAGSGSDYLLHAGPLADGSIAMRASDGKFAEKPDYLVFTTLVEPLDAVYPGYELMRAFVPYKCSPEYRIYRRTR